MDIIRYIIGQPTSGFSFYFRDNAGARVNLTGYTFTFDLTNEQTGATASYTVPASTTTSATFDLANITSSGTPITNSTGTWTGRILIEYNGNPYNVTVYTTIVVTD